jgi:hypothetical protein
MSDDETGMSPGCGVRLARGVVMGVVGILSLATPPLGPTLAASMTATGATVQSWSDRLDANPLNRGLARSVRRVYPGIRPDDTYEGWSRERFLAARGAPDQRRGSAPGEEHLIYFGKKTIFRGSGRSNRAVGPERHEYVVKDGSVVEGFVVVQVVEVGRRQGIFCEDYGDTKMDERCTDVAPLDATLPEAASQAAAFDYRCGPREAESPMGTAGVGSVEPSVLESFVETEMQRVVGVPGVTVARRPITPKQEGAIFLGKAVTRDGPGSDTTRTTHCAIASQIELRAGERGVVGAATIALCDRTSELTRSHVCEARAMLDDDLLALMYDPAEPPPALGKVSPERRVVAGGYVVETFPVLAISAHGWGIARTAIVTSGRSRYAVVVQLAPDSPCAAGDQAPLCTRPADIAAELGRRTAMHFLGRD